MITNLPLPPRRRRCRVRFISLGGEKYFEEELPYFETYAAAPEVKADQLFLVTSSAGTLEVAMREAAAAPCLGAQIGDRVLID